MFFVVGITWIAEVISFLLNYGFAYNNGGDVHTNAIIIKASFLFDCINAFQGIIMFCVLFFDAPMVRRIGKYVNPKSKKTPTSSGSMKSEKSIRVKGGGAVKFDHHGQQLTIRTNRTWRTPSPQPSPGMQPITTQVEVTEEYCSRGGNAVESTDEISGGLEVARFEMKTQSANCSSDACRDSVLQDKRPDHQITTVDFTMQFP